MIHSLRTKEEKEPHAHEFAFHISAYFLADIFGNDFSNHQLQRLLAVIFMSLLLPLETTTPS